jgi:hypothetical protein
MAIGAGGPDTMGILTTMHIGIVGGFEWGHGMAIHTELCIGCGGKAFIRDNP